MRAFVFLVSTGLLFAQSSVESPDLYLMQTASGTSRNPESRSLPMLMRMEHSWSLMLMGQAFIVDTQQKRGPRGADKLYSTNWFMGSAEHSLAGGTLMFETMLSLEPATITGERYPELFQTGETAYGMPIVDGQHPHNFVMGLGAHYAHRVGESVMLHFYYAPVGDPALGPVAFPHRASAQEIPEAPLGHHWQDSTHISDNVATGRTALQNRQPRSQRVPWNRASGEPLDSHLGSHELLFRPIFCLPRQELVGADFRWPHRASRARPTRRHHPLYCIGFLHPPSPLREAWASSLIWGRNHETLTGRDLNSYLAESVYPVTRKNFVTGRIELVDKDELFEDQPSIQALLDRTAGSTFRVQAYTGGYTRDIAQIGDAETGLGFNLSAYAIPQSTQPYYGNHPWGVNVFLRLRLKR